MRRIEHLSSRHSSPRHDDEDAKSERYDNFGTSMAGIEKEIHSRTLTEGTPRSTKRHHKENSFSGGV
jgi:hypothetical protein